MAYWMGYHIDSSPNELKKPLTPKELREMGAFETKVWTIMFAILLFVVGFFFTIAPTGSTWAVIGGVTSTIIGFFISYFTNKTTGIVLAIIFAVLHIIALL
jgi:hypothetical protein